MRFYAVLSLGLLMLPSYSNAQEIDPSSQFREAFHLEEVKGDLEAAISLYRQVANSEDQSLGAQAQFRIGLCYEKLGETQAISAYETVLENYADQVEIVTAARNRLVELRNQESSRQSPTSILFPDQPLEAPQLSPDGTRLAGTDFSIGQNIGIYDLARKETELLTRHNWTSKESGWTYWPVWSPDGLEVVYSYESWDEEKPQELRITQVGRDTRTLYRHEPGAESWMLPCDWLQDGSAILAMMKRPDNSGRLGLISVDDGSFTALRETGQEPGGLPRDMGCGHASPDGRFVIFADGPTENRDIHIMSIDGDSVAVLSEHPADEIEPRWSPDGKHIVFVSERHGTPALWGIAVEDGKATGSPFLIQNGFREAWVRNWTSQGLLYIGGYMMFDVFTAPMDASANKLVGRHRQIQYSPTGSNMAPAWSPDGKYLALLSGKPSDPPGRGYIVVIPRGEGEPREFPIPTDQLRFVGTHDLRWLADSDRLGFTGESSEGEHTLFRLSVSRGEWETWRLPIDSWTRTEWNSDGKSFLYARRGTAEDDPGIIERVLATGQERHIHRPAVPQGLAVGYRGLKFSSDYRQLAVFESIYSLEGENREATGSHITVVNMESGQSRRVAVKQGLRGQSWSPDGKFLIAHGRPKEGGRPRELHLISLVDGSTEQLILREEFPENTHLFSMIDWSPDGKEIVFCLRSMNFETRLLTNILAGDGFDSSQ
jgi:Tol biopolymer transport system component